MEYCESELFKKWVTLLYSENGSGSPIDAQTINLWLLHDAGFLVTADFYLALMVMSMLQSVASTKGAIGNTVKSVRS